MEGRIHRRMPSVLRMLPALRVKFDKGTWCCKVEKEDLVSRLVLLKKHRERQCKRLVDVIGVHYPDEGGFRVHYVLVSYRYQVRLVLRTFVREGESLPRVMEVYPAANWMEREIWDMFGIPFDGHRDMRRILTDYGFEGHPMRKDFPLRGFREVRYDEEAKRVVMDEVQLRQGYRRYDFASPWTAVGTDKR